MIVFQSVAALFAVYMLARHAPRAYATLRGGGGGGGGDRAGALVPLLNVALALAILVVAVKGLAGALISR